MPKLTINGMEIEVEQGTTVMQAAKMLGIEIPHFCYHDKLSSPANCRMCLVEIEGGPPKPSPSCTTMASEGMVVHTDSKMVKKARQGVMEMTLVNHPLDCPICDQGGECHLQDQAFAYGFDRSRYHESKRAVHEKDFGPLIKANMTRCIHCTRCVRFCDEVAGTAELGMLCRGEDSEIDTYAGGYIATELSGNLVDICPVGALTSGPYAFRARPWELAKTDSIDVHDALGCNIRLDSRGGEILRIVPRVNDEVNETWIDDSTRFSCDGLVNGRIETPMVKDESSGELVEVSWDEAFSFIAKKLSEISPAKMAALAGDLCDVESMVALKDLMGSLGCNNIDCRTDGAKFDLSARCGYLFNSGIAGIDEADVILIVGCNPRAEAAVLNARIRKACLKRRVRIGIVGASADLTYPYESLGGSPSDLKELLKPDNDFYKILAAAEKPMIIVGSGAFCREDGLAVHCLVREVAEHFGMVSDEWNGFNVLHRAASRVGGIECGFVPAENGLDFKGIIEGTRDGSIQAVYLLGADEFDARAEIGWKTFVIYQGHHYDMGAARADVILPGAAYTEKDATYVNTEGRIQRTRRAVFPPGEAKSDWKIIRALSEKLGKTLPYDGLSKLREKISADCKAFYSSDKFQEAIWAEFGGEGDVADADFVDVIENFYLKNSICRASKTMKECSRVFVYGEEDE